jgi:hypothetical protein
VWKRFVSQRQSEFTDDIYIHQGISVPLHLMDLGTEAARLMVSGEGCHDGHLEINSIFRGDDVDVVLGKMLRTQYVATI